MKTERIRCTSCGTSLEAERIKVEFPCPSCDKVNIRRCERCKKLSREYTCPECGFVGP